MIDKRIIYRNAEGGVSIVVPAPDTGLTLQEVISRSVPPGVSYKVVDASDIPTDRTFRDAWEYQE
jgi:hypothetical protein